MAPIEPKLVELVLAMAKIRRYLTVSETLGLANDLIKDSPLGKNPSMEEDVTSLGYQEKRSSFRKEILGPFNKRWKHKLVSKQGQKFAMDKNNALTYSNVCQIY